MEKNTTTNTNLIVIEYSTKVDYFTHSDSCQPMNQSVQAQMTKVMILQRLTIFYLPVLQFKV